VSTGCLSRRTLLGVLSVLFLVFAPLTLSAQQSFDILIRDGRVLDGTGNDWFHADVGVVGDEIVAVGDLQGAEARRVIEAEGLYVAPGFIDVHSHADRAMTSDHVEARQARSLTSQGLTTVVGAPDGRNQAWPLEVEVAALERHGHGMNFALMVGHNTVRGEVMGDDYERPATDEEIRRMREMVRQGMEAGAWGLGAGVEYRPGRFSTTDEVVALAEEVAPYDGFYIAHQRSEATMPLWELPSTATGWSVDGLQGLQETIEIARRTGIRVVGSHMKARGRSSFGRSAHDTLVIQRARAEGLQVYLDVYPYETFGGGPRPMIPKWALAEEGVRIDGGRDDPAWNEEGVFHGARENLRRRWDDPETRAVIERDIRWIVDHNGGEDRVIVVDYPDSAFVGKSLREIARHRRTTVPDLVVHMALNGYEDVMGGAWIRGYGIHDVDVVNYYRQDYTATGSDAGVSGVEGVEGFESRPGAHPRHFGAFTRRIARYVKDLQATSLPFAIRSMTGLPARIIGFEDRGFIREGYKADLVVFDYERLRDGATVLHPDRYSQGIQHVVVNGEFTVDEGQLTGALPGRVLRRKKR